MSRLLAYYAFGATAVPLQVNGPVTLLLAYVISFENFVDEFAIIGPLLGGLVIYKLYRKSFTLQFLLALVIGACGVACYFVSEIHLSWHSLWHVLASIAVALTIEREHVTVKPLVPPLPEKVSLRF